MSIPEFTHKRLMKAHDELSGYVVNGRVKCINCNHIADIELVAVEEFGKAPCEKCGSSKIIKLIPSLKNDSIACPDCEGELFGFDETGVAYCATCHTGIHAKVKF
jgi:hypothetical protein